MTAIAVNSIQEPRMNRTLEAIIDSAGRLVQGTMEGLLAGAVSVVDPVGAALNQAENQLAGGDLYRDNTRTLWNNVTRAAFNRQNYEELKPADYIGRGAGIVVGGAATAAAAGAALAALPWSALTVTVAGMTIPLVAGTYAVYKYATSDVPREGTFGEGLKYGFYRGIDPVSAFINDLYYNLAGKSPDQTPLKSLTHDAKAGTSLYALGGGLAGNIGGLALSVATLGILPLYTFYKTASRTLEENTGDGVYKTAKNKMSDGYNSAKEKVSSAVHSVRGLFSKTKLSPA